jgi:hypothetical protein
MRLNRQQARAAIANREAFASHTGNVSGGYGSGRGSGRLPAREREAWHRALRQDAGTYTVWSYVTPIAWHAPATGWVRPAVRYSRTTSAHQGMIPASVASVTAA